MSYSIHEHEQNGYTVKIFVDDDNRSLADMVYDKVWIGTWTAHKGTQMVYDDSEYTTDSLADFVLRWANVDHHTTEIFDDLDLEYEATPSGRIRITDGYFPRNGAFKTVENAVKAYFLHVYGHKLADFEAHRITDDYYLVVYKPEVDFAVNPDYIKYLRQIIDGEVYGYEITGPDDEFIDSCWGFVGYDHCRDSALEALNEAKTEEKE